MITANMKKRNVHTAKVQKAVEPNENFDLMGSETMSNVNLEFFTKNLSFVLAIKSLLKGNNPYGHTGDM